MSEPLPPELPVPKAAPPAAYFLYGDKYHCSAKCRMIPRRGEVHWDWTPTGSIDPELLRAKQCLVCCKVIDLEAEAKRRQKLIDQIQAQKFQEYAGEVDEEMAKDDYAALRNQIFDPAQQYNRKIWEVNGQLPPFTSGKFKFALGYAMAHAMIMDLTVGEIPDPLCAYCLSLIRIDPKTYHQLLSKHGIDAAAQPEEAGLSAADHAIGRIMAGSAKIKQAGLVPEHAPLEVDTGFNTE